MLESHGKRLLVDTPPELRLQLIAAGVDRIDAVLYTHAHADHVHGIDDLRALSMRQGAMLPTYGSRATMTELAGKFPYIFDPTFVVPAGSTRPELVAHVLEPGIAASIAGVSVLPLSRFTRLPMLYTIHHQYESELSALYQSRPEVDYVAISARQRTWSARARRSTCASIAVAFFSASSFRPLAARTAPRRR